MSTFFLVLGIGCAVATLVVLAVGLVGMANAGAFNRKYGNTLMRWRVILQAATLIFVGLALSL